MLKLKPLIYSPSAWPHSVVTEASTVPLRLAGFPVADKSSGSFPANSCIKSPHQLFSTRRRLSHRCFSVSMESAAGVNTATSSSVVKLKPIEATPESFKEFGQVIEASPDGEEFGPRDAQLDLSRGIPRFYVMQLKDRSLRFSKITHHANVTQCLGSIGGNVWYLGVAKPSIVDPADIKGAAGADIVQSRCGHFYVPPAVGEVQAFRISGPKFVKLNHGTWHAGPLFTDDKMDFYNLELNNTNVVDHTTHDFIKKNGVVFLLDD
ncbi:uncharacterized protein LOC107786328 [Nicotiana tabacum]|uniref:Uncharacterized protein LOC107786328 n=1 Tax=Nicotiana tabacum TaxID=4097 RepID=A0A1S3ZG01_TOBAC|nr:PREDICTED: uncharacterized protein LOC107786328 [Nicotiana tabacum]